MKFVVSRHDELPVSAWAVKWRPGSDQLFLSCGRGVHCDDDMFWEGVLPNPQTPKSVATDSFPLATGAMIDGQDLLVFTPGHVLDRVYLFKNSTAVIASNSLPMGLAAAGSKLIDDYLYYPYVFEKIRKHEIRLPVAGPCRASIFYNCNIRITSYGSTRVEQKPFTAEFPDYQAYHSFLMKTIERVTESLDLQPQKNWRQLTTLSRGYDSTAISALAATFGTKEAIAFSSSRQTHLDDDSGVESAAHLGLSVIKIGRYDYRNYGVEPEILFYATALPEDIPFFPLKERLNNTVLYSGYHGDTLWAINAKPMGTWRRDNCGASLQEFRLQCGFTHFPVAFIGWQRHREIIEISRSAEMANWSVGGNYDRPIPRRIAETAGVPRGAFGVDKRAIAVAIGFGGEDHYVSESFALALQARWTAVNTPWFRAKVGVLNQISNVVERSTEKIRASAAPKVNARPTLSPITTAIAKVGGSIKYAAWRHIFMRIYSPLTFGAQEATHQLAKRYERYLDNE